MSLQSLLYGYSGEIGCLESVEPELLEKYNCETGPVMMAMEAADMLHDIYMEAFYDTNDIEISAAMEGMTVLTEASEKGKSFKEKVSGAWGKLKELFLRFVKWLKGILGSVFKSIGDHLKKAKDFIKNIPSNVKARLTKLEYEGFKYTNLDNYAKFASKVDISSKNFKKLSEKLGKIVSNVSKDKYGKESEDDTFNSVSVDEDMDKKLRSSFADIKKIFGISEDSSSEDTSNALFGYFRGGAKNASAKTKQSISLSHAQSAVDDTEKLLSSINKLFSALQADYEFQAKVCAANEDRINAVEYPDVRVISSLVNGERKIASYCNRVNSFVSTVTNAWKNAAIERNNVYAQTIAKAAAEANKKEKED